MLRGLQYNRLANRAKMYYIGFMMAESDQMNDEQEKPEGCTKCGGSLDTSGYPLWCKKCQAKWHRQNYALKKELRESRGYAAGVSAFRSHLIQKLEKIPTGYTFNGPTAAEWVRNEQISLPQD